MLAIASWEKGASWRAQGWAGEKGRAPRGPCNSSQVAASSTILFSTTASLEGSLLLCAGPQSAFLKMVRQQHDAVGVEPRGLQGIDAAQDFVILQVDYRDRPVAHAFQIEEAILDEQVPFIR